MTTPAEQTTTPAELYLYNAYRFYHLVKDGSVLSAALCADDMATCISELTVEAMEM